MTICLSHCYNTAEGPPLIGHLIISPPSPSCHFVPVISSFLFAEAFLKKHISSEDLDKFGNTMAQLVDGRADGFAQEYMHLFSSSGVTQLQQHPDWNKLSTSDSRFAFKTFALLLFQSASSFDRRVVAPLATFPYILLSMGRVRHDLPDEKRKAVAKLVLETHPKQLDVNTLKIRNAFKTDLELARRTGMIGVQLFTALKAIRRIWKSDVRENERLNKQLKLFGERAPNSSLDLVSARLALKFRLGTAGLRQEEMETSKPRNWSRVKPMASAVFDECMEHWMASSPDVLARMDRFQEPCLPDWCPTRDEVHAWIPLLQPAKEAATDTASRILAGLVNRSLYRFLQGKATGKTKNPSEFPEPYFSAIALVSDDRLKPGRPYRLNQGSRVLVFCETVNRAVRLLRAIWNGSRIIPDRPWSFLWGADVIFDFSSDNMVGKPFTLIAFPIHWQPTSAAGGDVMLEGTCLSKSGDPFVTISFWEEVAWTL